MPEFENVLVTGGAGYIGSLLCEQLLAKGYKVRALDSLIFGDRGVKHLAQNENFELLEGKLESAETLKNAVQNMNAVVHLAGFANDPTCDLNPELTKLINYEATVKLVQLSKEVGVRKFLYGSSAAIYGASETIASTEDSPLAPVSLYAKYRVKCEEEIFAQDSQDFDTCCMRKSTVFGYSPRLRLDLVVNAMTAHAVNKGELMLIGGSQWRPNLHVADAAGVYVAALEAPADRMKKQAFNVGANSTNHKVSEIAEMVAESIPNTKIDRKPPRDAISYNLSFDKLNNVLKFNAYKRVKEGISEIADAFKKGLIPDYQNSVYYNLAHTKKLLEDGKFGI